MRYLAGFASQHEYLFGLAYIAIWSEMEICLSIIAGSLPIMRPLLRYLQKGSAHKLSDRPGTQPEILRLKASDGWKRSSSRHVSKCGDGEGGAHMGNSFYVGAGAKGDHEAGDVDDGGSQRHILTEARLEIFKETQYEVRSERGVGDPELADRV